MAATVGAEALALDWERGMDGYAENEVRGRAAGARPQAPAGVAGRVARGKQPVWESARECPGPGALQVSHTQPRARACSPACTAGGRGGGRQRDSGNCHTHHRRGALHCRQGQQLERCNCGGGRARKCSLAGVLPPAGTTCTHQPRPLPGRQLGATLKPWQRPALGALPRRAASRN